MPLTINGWYRDPRHPDTAGASIVGSESEGRDAIERLRGAGYKVTGVTPTPPKTSVFQERPLRDRE